MQTLLKTFMLGAFVVLSACAKGGSDSSGDTTAVVTANNCSVNQVYTTQYGCLPQGSCPVSQGFYNGTCIAGTIGTCGVNGVNGAYPYNTGYNTGYPYNGGVNNGLGCNGGVNGTTIYNNGYVYTNGTFYSQQDYYRYRRPGNGGFWGVSGYAGTPYYGNGYNEYYTSGGGYYGGGYGGSAYYGRNYGRGSIAIGLSF